MTSARSSPADCPVWVPVRASLMTASDPSAPMAVTCHRSPLRTYPPGVFRRRLLARVTTWSPTPMTVPSDVVTPDPLTSPSVTRSLWARVFNAHTVAASAASRIAGTPASVSACQAV
ncbi:hypothetical protein GALL_464790 [mine drainage metagenome]|uniref:Uncharacterized protein n=1 Tax=mine drainage metagenome TaxID=410659 RepID=A0A1J5PWH1_9ZZZZ